MDYNTRAAAVITEANQVGNIQKAYGKEGELVIRIWDTFPDNLDEPIWIEVDSLAVPLFIASFETQGNTKAVIRFDDFETAEKAAMLIGKKIYSEIAVKETELNGDWDFLIGYSFRDISSGKEGAVIDFIGNELNPLIEVEIGGKEHLLPIDDNLVENLNEKKKIIEMRLAEGIFDLD